VLLRKQLRFDQGRLVKKILEFATGWQSGRGQAAEKEVQMILRVLMGGLATEMKAKLERLSEQSANQTMPA
jgi:hypothetical protein